MSNEIICLKNDGTVKFIGDQFELNKLNPDDYASYWFPVDDDSSIYKKFNPHSKFVTPIRKVVVEYSLVLYSDHHPCWDDDMEEEMYDTGFYNSHRVIRNEFDDVRDFIKFIQSINNLSAFNTQFSVSEYTDGYNEVSRPIVCIGGFIMHYTELGDKAPREFKLKKKHCKLTHDVMKDNGCFMLPTLLAAITKFFDETFEFNSTINSNVYINRDLTLWDTKKHKEWLKPYYLLPRNVYVFLNEQVIDMISAFDMIGRVTLCEYNLMVSEDILPEEPITVELVEDYNQCFDMYDAHQYVTSNVCEIIELLFVSLNVINTASMIRDLNPTTRDLWEKSMIQFQVRYDGRYSTGDLKFIVYNSDVIESNPNEIFGDFMKTWFLEIDKPF